MQIYLTWAKQKCSHSLNIDETLGMNEVTLLLKNIDVSDTLMQK